MILHSALISKLLDARLSHWFHTPVLLHTLICALTIPDLANPFSSSGEADSKPEQF